MSVRKMIFLTAAVAMVCGLAGSAMAESIASVLASPSGTTGLGIGDTNTAVVEAIVTTPTTVNGVTTHYEGMLVDDGTGSIYVYGALPSSGGYTPAVGDAITTTGNEFYVYHGMNELQGPGSSYYQLANLTQVSAGNATYGPTATTINQINGATIPNSLNAKLLTITATIGGGMTGVTFGTGTLTGTVTDSTGSESLYYWPTSYSVANANLDGFVPVAGQEYTITGLASNYGGTEPEFIPLEITPAAVPEPMTIIPACAGLVLSIGACIRRKFS